jgi:Protein of unknown function (DUF3500)
MPDRRELATQMAEAASAWLDSLEGDQRRVAIGTTPADDATDAERRRWFYTPTDHGGLTLHDQRPLQQQGAMRLVSSGLSMAGYVTVVTAIGLENVLDRVEGFGEGFGRLRGRDPGLYYLRVFGEPGGDRPWGWRFGGHHVSLNNLVVDGELVSTTPLFLGADPASSPLLGGAVNRPLGRVEDLARELVVSLSGELRERALLQAHAPSDILTTNEPAIARSLDPLGVAGSDLDRSQRELLRDLLGTYVNRVPEGAAPSYDEAALDAVHVAWAGPTEPGAPHYYRLQGPGLLVEWDNTQRGANHAHSVWRDPGSDFGSDLLARHRTAHH